MHKKKSCALHMGSARDQNARELHFRETHVQEMGRTGSLWNGQGSHGQGSVQYMKDVCLCLKKVSAGKRRRPIIRLPARGVHGDNSGHSSMIGGYCHVRFEWFGWV